MVKETFWQCSHSAVLRRNNYQNILEMKYIYWGGVFNRGTFFPSTFTVEEELVKVVFPVLLLETTPLVVPLSVLVEELLPFILTDFPVEPPEPTSG